MHTSMTELLEQLKPGLVWVGADGTVRYANRAGHRSTGLAVGSRLGDRLLAQAVVTASVGQVPRQVTLAPQGGRGQELDCRVIPGLDGDDAFVLVHDAPDEAAGMDSLMQTIRLDLRDPLRAARAALSVARAADADGDTLEIEALLDRVDDLLMLADRLVDLATLWDGNTVVGDDRIELWPLLQDVWGEVEPLAMSRQVTVRFTTDIAARDMATLYGSARWMHRVFVECLQGAVRWAPRGSEIEVEHLQDGPRASIVLRDTRLFSTGARGADAVSLKLCRHVLALHGGRLREELEGRHRHLVIELPTGAPQHHDDPQLAIAQAQQYARDLAALMTRARRPAGQPAPADQA